MTAPLRSVLLSSGHVLTTWDTGGYMHDGKSHIRYEMREQARDQILTGAETEGRVLFSGEDFGASPLHTVDSDQTLLGLLTFLTLRPGDTDRDYFDNYDAAQHEWCESSACEQLAGDVCIASEAVGREGCACSMWENVQSHECEGRGNVSDFEVLDHGEDGSQYFPGCGVYGTRFAHVVTGVGDTGAEALDDALKQMAMSEPEARPSALQEAEMRACLNNPDKSAHEGNHTAEELADEDFDHDLCDWSHWVSIRYNVRED